MEENKEQEVVQDENKGFSIASMVLGIISIVLFCIWYLSIPCAILAIIFGIVGMKKGARGMAIAGLVLGIIAVAMVAILYILAAIGIASMGTAFSSMM